MLLVAALSTSTLANPGGMPAENGPGSAAGSPVAVARSLPLDFAYRVQGSGPAIGMVFDDGKDVFMQPVHPLQVSTLRVGDLPHTVQGPYLVIRGLTNRIEVSTGSSSASTVVEYRGMARPETVVRECILTAGDEQRATIPFGTGALQTEPGGFEHLARVIALARGADRVTIVSQGDRPGSAIALRRAARVRELLVAAGVAPTAIIEQVKAPAASSVHVVATRKASGCPPVHASSTPAPAPDPRAAFPSRAAGPTATAAGIADDGIERISASAHSPEGARVPIPSLSLPREEGGGSAAPEMSSAVDIQTEEARGGEPSAAAGYVPGAGLSEVHLRFRPNSSVQATLRDYLRAHGMAVEFRQVPLLMVEEFAEVSGADMREVLRRALSRLGLRGEIQGNRLLVVELAR